MKERKDTKAMIESVREFDFFDVYNIDMETFNLFKYKFDMNFKRRKQPDIFYRNFFIIGLYKNINHITVTANLMQLDHTTIIHSIKRTCDFVQNKDKEIIEIFEQVKFFFERYGKLKAFKYVDGSSENEFLSSLELERRVFFTGLVKPN